MKNKTWKKIIIPSSFSQLFLFYFQTDYALQNNLGIFYLLFLIFWLKIKNNEIAQAIQAWIPTPQLIIIQSLREMDFLLVG